MGASSIPATLAKTRFVQTLTSGTSYTVPLGVIYLNVTLRGGGGGGGGGTWVQTSYNANIRGKYAGIGDIYDEANDEFYTPEPEPLTVTSTQIEQPAIETTEATKEVK